MIVRLIQNQSSYDEYEPIIESLLLGKHYEVIGIEADHFRIICETDNEPYLYPPDCFEIIDNSKPKFWKTEIGEDGEEYSYPSSWNQVGFFEDYFAGKKEVVTDRPKRATHVRPNGAT